MEWVLDTHYAHLFHKNVIIELSILVMDAGESNLLDLMNAITAKYPTLKLFSLPRLDERRTIELGMKGDESLVDEAMTAIKATIIELGFEWQEFKA
jgi:molybdopterin-biosynthesis enzyme MoeA-like protein